MDELEVMHEVHDDQIMQVVDEMVVTQDEVDEMDELDELQVMDIERVSVLQEMVEMV